MARRLPHPIYMMATQAMHCLGDISRMDPDLCVVHSETDTHYIGNWVTGFGFIGVEFPKETTRVLHPAEIERFSKMRYQINNQPVVVLNFTKENTCLVAESEASAPSVASR